MTEVIVSFLMLFTVMNPAFHGGINHDGFPKAKNGIVYLDRMPGGRVIDHIYQARIWVREGYRVVIRGDLYSAAAMMAVEIKNRGGQICATKNADLYFHIMSNGDHPSVVIGKATRKIIGSLTRRFKRISPSRFGIEPCR